MKSWFGDPDKRDAALPSGAAGRLIVVGSFVRSETPGRRAASSLFKLLVVLLGTICLGGSMSAAGAAEPRRPNVILVLADDLGLSRVGCYGGGPFRTPHLDQMARRRPAL